MLELAADKEWKQTTKHPHHRDVCIVSLCQLTADRIHSADMVQSILKFGEIRSVKVVSPIGLLLKVSPFPAGGIDNR